MDTEADKSGNDSQTLQDYMRHVEKQSNGRKTMIYFTIFINRASLLRVQKML